MKITRFVSILLLIFFFSSCTFFKGGRPRSKERNTFGITAGPVSRLDDTARFLAGMPGGTGSRFAKQRQTGTWQTHAAQMDKMFAHYEATRQNPIMRWQASELGDIRSNVVFYPFGGPDFAFANSFFPSANRYILAGLEAPNMVPDPDALSGDQTAAGLSNLRTSLNSIIYNSFFITKNMSADLNQTRVNGTMPLVLVFLARTGHRIQSVELVDLTPSGALASRSGSGGGAPGYHIVARGPHGGSKDIYYFKEDLSNGTVNSDPRLLRFVANQGTPVTYLKSASYLMHNSGFSAIREGILNQSSAVVTDPSGIPFRSFRPDSWNVRLYGSYTGDIAIFSGNYQSDLRSAYSNGKHRVGSMPFGVGYKQTTLIVAKKR